MAKIYIKDNTPKDLPTLLRKFFGNKTDFYVIRGVETYHDKECTNVQCRKGKYRSFDDIMICVRTYFPYISTKRVLHELLILDYKDYHFRFFDCNDIDMPTVCYSQSEQQDQTYLNSGIKIKSKYSWKELFAKLKITTHKDYVKYIKKHKKQKLDESIIKG